MSFRAVLFVFLLAPLCVADEACEEVVAGDISPTREALLAVLVPQCASCHRGPFLDFSTYPFHSTEFPTEKALLTESLRRAKLDGFRRMPPVNFAPLSAEEILLLERYVAQLK